MVQPLWKTIWQLLTLLTLRYHVTLKLHSLWALSSLITPWAAPPTPGGLAFAIPAPFCFTIGTILTSTELAHGDTSHKGGFSQFQDLSLSTGNSFIHRTKWAQTRTSACVPWGASVLSPAFFLSGLWLLVQPPVTIVVTARFPSLGLLDLQVRLFLEGSSSDTTA